MGLDEETRSSIELANLRRMVDDPASLLIYRDEYGLTPRDFAVPDYRRAYKLILEAAGSGAAIPDEVLAILAAHETRS